MILVGQTQAQLALTWADSVLTEIRHGRLDVGVGRLCTSVTSKTLSDVGLTWVALEHACARYIHTYMQTYISKGQPQVNPSVRRVSRSRRQVCSCPCEYMEDWKGEAQNT